jgi:hypothetical protein
LIYITLLLFDGLFLSQSIYVLDLLNLFKMFDCKMCAIPFQLGIKLTKYCQSPKVDTTLYRQLVDNLIYLTHSLLDISFVVSVVSRFMLDPHTSHWKDTQRIVCYIEGASHLSIKYCRNLDSLVGFTGFEWADENDDRKYTSGYIFTLALDLWFGHTRNKR